jgi:beta-ribofuranosylaminobenzene 5'-phosphate synthase
MTMAALMASARVTGRKLSPEALQKLSARGGASGIGIHGFFQGGFVVDAGKLGAHPFLPSSAQQTTVLPTLNRAAQAPEGWIVTLVLPPGIRRSGIPESNFFQQATPIPKLEVIQQIAIVYHELLPAVLEDNLETFGAALDRFAMLGFKAREIQAQEPTVMEVMTMLRGIAPCVGMSSMGPLVFALSRVPIISRIPTLPAGTIIMGQSAIATEGFRVQDA